MGRPRFPPPPKSSPVRTRGGGGLDGFCALTSLAWPCLPQHWPPHVSVCTLGGCRLIAACRSLTLRKCRLRKVCWGVRTALWQRSWAAEFCMIIWAPKLSSDQPCRGAADPCTQAAQTQRLKYRTAPHGRGKPDQEAPPTHQYSPPRTKASAALRQGAPI